MAFKIHFEMTKEQAITAALNAGSKAGEEAELFGMGIQRKSAFKMIVKDDEQHNVLQTYQGNGYHVTKIEAA